jgi:hypothetical protein
VALIAASLAALFVLVNLFSAGFRVICLGVIVAAAVLAARSRALHGGGWWWLLAAGAAGSVIGAIVAQPAANLGGWLALLSGLLVMAAAAIGYPWEER